MKHRMKCERFNIKKQDMTLLTEMKQKKLLTNKDINLGGI